jgi:DNA-binding transcriptional LysR family regulator
MEIYQLKAFIVVARVGHLTRAAEQLHLSQSAVSKQIRALEDTLGVRLFDRLPWGMSLTRTGRDLLTEAEATLRHALQLQELASRLRGEVAGSVRLGTIIDPEYLRLGSFLGKLLEDYPFIDVKLHHGISGWVLEQLLADELDAGFCLGNPPGGGLVHVQIARPIYVVVGPVSWRERIESAGWRELSLMPWVGTPQHSSQHDLTARMAQQQGLAFSFVVEADQESSMIHLVSTGVGLCLMREDLALAAQRRGELVVWQGVRQPCPLSFVYPAARADEHVLAAVLHTLRAIWGLEAGG